MRKLILSMQTSLDGYVEGPDGDNSWMIIDDPDQWSILSKMWKTVDLFVLGRVTFPDYRDHWKNALTDPRASADEKVYAEFAAATKHIVFSNTLKDADWQNSEIIAGDAVKEIQKLKQQPGKDIQIVGGARLAASAMEAGLVDEFVITISPAIVGGGKSFFRDQHKKYHLDLVWKEETPRGVIMLRYKKKPE